SFSTSSLAIGSHTITASYSGDGNFAASTGALTQTVGKGNSSTVVTASVNPTVWGQSVTFTATVSGSSAGNPTGAVVFSDGGTSIGQRNLSTTGTTTTASFSTSSLAVGSHPITASYGGDGNFLSSTGAVTQTVGKGNSSTVVVSSVNPSVWGQSVTFTA